MRVVGLDLSPTATGIAWTHNIVGRFEPRCLTVRSTKRGHERTHDVWSAVASIARTRPDLWVMEGGYVGGNSNANTLVLAGLREVIGHWLWSQGHIYVEVAPGTVKVYATGRGNLRGENKVTKTEVLEKTIARYGHLLHIGDDNQADAVTLMAMGCAAYGHALADVPATHSRALQSVTWPDIKIPLPADAALGSPSAGGGANTLGGTR